MEKAEKGRKGKHSAEDLLDAGLKLLETESVHS